METHDAVVALAALSHKIRLQAFRELVQAGPGGLSVGELRDRLDIPPATLSAYLNTLRASGLVADEREGRVIRVRADFDRMNLVLGFLTENCCGGSTCVPVKSRKPPTKSARR